MGHVTQKAPLSGGGQYRLQDEQRGRSEEDVQISWCPVGLGGSWVPAEPNPNAAESRQYIFSVSFQMISGGLSISSQALVSPKPAGEGQAEAVAQEQ